VDEVQENENGQRTTKREQATPKPPMNMKQRRTEQGTWWDERVQQWRCVHVEVDFATGGLVRFGY